MANDKEYLLGTLPLVRLHELAALWSIAIEDRRLKAPGIAKLMARKRSLSVTDILGAMSAEEIRGVCVELGLAPETTTADLAARLTGRAWRAVRRAERDFSVVPLEVGASVVRVVDGDTLEVRLEGDERPTLVRIRGVDAAESHESDKFERDVDRAGHAGEQERALGRAATAYLETRVRPGDSIVLEVERRADGSFVKLHQYRLLAFVRLPTVPDGDLGLDLLRSGHALVWPRNVKSRRYAHPRIEGYLEACNAAFRERPGLWPLGLVRHCPMGDAPTCRPEDCVRHCSPAARETNDGDAEEAIDGEA